MTWAQFKEEVMTKYFPQSLRDRREAEFLQLKQGNMLLDEYERKFEQLSRYATHLVDTEPKKARRFELGLRPEIGGIMASHHTTTYSEVLQRAQSIYDRLEMDRMTEKNNESYGKRKWNGSNKGKGLGQFKKSNIRSESGSSKPNKVTPRCPKCNKAHGGECWFGKNVCYRYGQEGHFASDCKAYPPKKDNEQGRKVKAKVFALTREEATEDPNVMAGILSISELPAYVLIDSGATHSFISTAFIAKSRTACEKSDSVLEISIPSGRILNTNQIARAVKLVMEGKEFVADLHLLDMKDFDVILGMDWLGSNHATIRCFEKEVVLKRPGEDEFRFFAVQVKSLQRILSAMKAEKMLKKRFCQGFLVSIHGTQHSELTICNVLVVRDFIDVFPNDLPGAPPD
ncbi:uncharacterized protein LOC111385281, partial [Olea europaea var. sylvestris]|uniref:uncharacterized protein LOC111385281 n=1 Tax=Olea europaea var. sylvestris TaxID=158386 RepID=UPI000C1CD2DD